MPITNAFALLDMINGQEQQKIESIYNSNVYYDGSNEPIIVRQRQDIKWMNCLFTGSIFNQFG